ncbi:hypothetical protein [Streptomyces phytohabitans]|uniref:hypothetical protein n=1 Tax=Streptomyces phytohabitans TaxID=1150371 RepID=UPI00345C59C3
MHAHTQARAPALVRAPGPRTERRHGAAWWTLPLLAGVAYGAYAWFLARDERFTTAATVVGLVSGVLAALVLAALAAVRPSVPAEPRAAGYGAACGIGVGYLSALTGPSVLWSSVLGLLVAAGVAPAVLYRLSTRQD